MAPRGKFQEHVEPLQSIPRVLSIPVIAYPETGSFPESAMVPVPLHQPLFPGTVQEALPETVAFGRAVPGLFTVEDESQPPADAQAASQM